MTWFLAQTKINTVRRSSSLAIRWLSKRICLVKQGHCGQLYYFPVLLNIFTLNLLVTSRHSREPTCISKVNTTLHVPMWRLASNKITETCFYKLRPCTWKWSQIYWKTFYQRIKIKETNDTWISQHFVRTFSLSPKGFAPVVDMFHKDTLVYPQLTTSMPFKVYPAKSKAERLPIFLRRNSIAEMVSAISEGTENIPMAHLVSNLCKYQHTCRKHFVNTNHRMTCRPLANQDAVEKSLNAVEYLAPRTWSSHVRHSKSIILHRMNLSCSDI